jgi:hypothetical protein
MAVNKNFVVKNGLEVNNSLILADASTNKVGIGSTAPRTELDVRGGIAATDIQVSGISTFLGNLKIGTDGGTLSAIGSSVGIGSTLPRYLLDIQSSGDTGTTALYVKGDVDITGNFSGAEVAVTSINVTGLSSLGSVHVNSGIVTASTTSGIVTYYGDGSELTGIGIGINSGGTVVGSSVTTIDFKGSGISTTHYNSSVGIATIFFNKGSVSIGSEAPSNPDNGGLWYSTVFGRTYIYYDEVALGIGSTAVWVDSSPFNIGILDLDSLSTQTLSITNDITTVRNINATGIVTCQSLVETSDRNLKTNIQTVDNALDIVGNLRGVSFDWKSNGNPSYGVIAQELEQVLPELVSDGDPKAVSYNGIIGVLIEAIKELKEEIEELKKK